MLRYTPHSTHYKEFLCKLIHTNASALIYIYIKEPAVKQ